MRGALLTPPPSPCRANNRLRGVSTVTNIASTLAGNGTAGLFDSAVGTRAMLGAPNAVAVDATGRVFFTDSSSETLRVVAPCAFASATQTPTPSLSPGASPSWTPTGTPSATSTLAAPGCTVTTYAGSIVGSAGVADGVGLAATFNGPFSLAFSIDGASLYVTERTFGRVRVVQLSTGAVSTLAGSTTASGYVDGVGTNALFGSLLAAIVVDAAGALIVADRGNNLLRRILPTGLVTTFAGTTAAGCADGWPWASTFNSHSGLAWINSTALVVANSACHNIRVVLVSGVGATSTAGNTTTLAGSVAGTIGWADGAASAARFNSPRCVTPDATTGNIFVAEDFGGRIRVISPSGFVSTVAGNTGSLAVASFADGLATTAYFNSPNFVTLWPQGGGLLATEWNNNRVRAIALPSRLVTTFAGCGVSGMWDGAAATARFRNPAGLIIDANNTMWLADSANNAIRRIVCPVTPTPSPSPSRLASASPTPSLAGSPSKTPSPSVTIAPGAQCVVTTLAGLPSFLAGGYADGTASAAFFTTPTGLALDATGAFLYVSETPSHRIRRVETATGVVTTLCGSGLPAWADGQGTQASLNLPQHMTIDASGMLYVADSGAQAGASLRAPRPAGVDWTTLLPLRSSHLPQVTFVCAPSRRGGL